MELFEPDEGRLRVNVQAKFTESGQLEVHAAPRQVGEFFEDKGRVAVDTEFLVRRLMDEWGLGKIPLHSVDCPTLVVHQGRRLPIVPYFGLPKVNGRAYTNATFRVSHGGLLPSVRCIQDTFGISYSLAKRVLEQIRKLRCIHTVNAQKRALRGDCLQRYFRQQEELKKALIAFARFERLVDRIEVATVPSKQKLWVEPEALIAYLSVL